MVAPLLFKSKVRHRRLIPKENYFCYKTFYIAIDLMKKNTLSSNFIFGINRRALLSYKDKDHGQRDGSDVLQWAKSILSSNDVNNITSIILVAMPRVLGYVFNPVSFYFCRCDNDKLRAVIVEVNNTFGETHSYLCLPEENKTDITNKTWLTATKEFHVSPFMERKGHYHFRFDIKKNQSNIIIHYTVDHKKMLVTSIQSTHQVLNLKNCLFSALKIPFMTFKVVFLIHYQACKIFLKKIAYVKKPIQKAIKLSHTDRK
jgi:uncharacterized protein